MEFGKFLENSLDILEKFWKIEKTKAGSRFHRDFE